MSSYTTELRDAIAEADRMMQRVTYTPARVWHSWHRLYQLAQRSLAIAEQHGDCCEISQDVLPLEQPNTGNNR